MKTVGALLLPGLASCGTTAEAPISERWAASAAGVQLKTLLAQDEPKAPENVSGRAGDLMLQNEQVAFVISDRSDEDRSGHPGAVLDAYLIEQGRRQRFDSIDDLWPLINGAPVQAAAGEISQPDAETLEVRFSGPQRLVPGAFDLAAAEPDIELLECEVAYR